ncbi:hypothetical protein DFH09DRAFT_1338162 [Mycena vulgaris]|nr:hypothetical protein DFH09DRAFT_1338162 [Mycena vulgaris]
MKLTAIFCLLVASLSVSGLPASVCNGITACLACTKNSACAFNSNTLTCGARVSTAEPFVTNAKLCPPLKQAAQIAPTAAEVQKAKAMFAAMQKHVLIGEKDPKSGRHTFSARTSANKDAGRCDSESKLCAFRLNQGVPKTVFDDRAGGFTASDVQQMCTTAITLNIQLSAGKLQTAAFVVQTKFGHPICVEHLVAEQGSCFPLGIHATSDKLSTECSPGSGNKPIAGKTTEIPAR